MGFSKTWLGRIYQNKKTCENTFSDRGQRHESQQTAERSIRRTLEGLQWKLSGFSDSSVRCPFVVRISGYICPMSVRCHSPSSRTKTRQSCSDSRCSCPPTSRDPAVFWELEDLWKSWKIFLGCPKVRIKLGLILISVEFTAKYHVNYVVTMRYEKIIMNK